MTGLPTEEDRSVPFSVLPLPRSVIEGEVFPALPGDNAAHLLALLFQLDRTQWWTADRLRATQLRQLDAVARHAWQSVPFYRDRLAAAGYDPARPVSREILSKVPLLTRADIQQAGQALHSVQGHPGPGEAIPNETSGSTGRPVAFLTTVVEQVFWLAFTLREHLWHRRDLTARLGMIRNASRNGRTDGWGPQINKVFPTGPGLLLRIDTPLSGQIAWLLQEQPNYLLSFPTNIEALARECLRQRISMPWLRQVCSVSETARPELRALVREAWGVQLVDMYSAKEVGYIALQCPDYDHYHVQEESVLVEILDAAGQPCPPGVAGRVVVTALHKFAMPLIRYEIGDYAIPGGPCACGRGLGAIKEVLGRTRNMLRLPGGEQCWPQCSLANQPEVPGILQYQYVQKSLQRIEVHLVVGPVYSREREPRLREIVRERLRHPFEVEFFYHDDIPRSPSGKFEDFRCEIPEG